MRPHNHDPRAEHRLEIDAACNHGKFCPCCSSEDVKAGACPDPSQPLVTADYGCRNCGFMWDTSDAADDVLTHARAYRQRKDIVPVTVPDHYTEDVQ